LNMMFGNGYVEHSDKQSRYHDKQQLVIASVVGDGLVLPAVDRVVDGSASGGKQAIDGFDASDDADIHQRDGEIHGCDDRVEIEAPVDDLAEDPGLRESSAGQRPKQDGVFAEQRESEKCRTVDQKQGTNKHRRYRDIAAQSDEQVESRAGHGEDCSGVT